MLRPVILEAAMRLFAQQGGERPTMDEVAAAAGVQKPTLYAYFDGKSVLVEAVIDMLLQELPTLQTIDQMLPLREQLVDIGLQLQRLVAHTKTFASILESTQWRLSAKQSTVRQERLEEFECFMAGLLKRHCDCEQPERIAQQFMLLVAGNLHPVSEANIGIDTPRIEMAADLIIRIYPPRNC